MARTIKKGLRYFPLDVDTFRSDKIRLIQAKCGKDSLLMILQLLCKIYESDGYYYTWGEDQELLFAANEGYTIQFVKEVIKECLHRKFFDINMFDQYSVLTSHGIQIRYFEIIKKNKLKTSSINHNLLLLNEEEKTLFGIKIINVESMNNNSELIPKNDTTDDINSEFKPQKDEFMPPKERKENKTKENKTKVEGENTTTQNVRLDSKSLRDRMLSPAWLEEVCISQLFPGDDFRQFVDNYLKLKELSGECSSYTLSQHKRFVITDFTNRQRPLSTCNNPPNNAFVNNLNLLKKRQSL